MTGGTPPSSIHIPSGAPLSMTTSMYTPNAPSAMDVQQTLPGRGSSSGMHSQQLPAYQSLLSMPFPGAPSAQQYGVYPPVGASYPSFSSGFQAAPDLFPAPPSASVPSPYPGYWNVQQGGAMPSSDVRTKSAYTDFMRNPGPSGPGAVQFGNFPPSQVPGQVRGNYGAYAAPNPFETLVSTRADRYKWPAAEAARSAPKEPLEEVTC